LSGPESGESAVALESAAACDYLTKSTRAENPLAGVGGDPIAGKRSGRSRMTGRLGSDASTAGTFGMDANQLQRRAQEASELLKALGNAHRLMILCQLLEGEKSVGELVRSIGLSQSALSQHLARLRRDHLVSTRRSAQTIYYAIAAAEARSVLQTLHALYCGRELPETTAGASEVARLSL
jgi:DNA-binding transcriptional ArsR family regulator